MLLHQRAITNIGFHSPNANLQGVVLLPKGSAENRNVWEPTQIPTPTYLSAPKAITPKRVLDLTTPGAWTEEQERLAKEALAAAALVEMKSLTNN